MNRRRQFHEQFTKKLKYLEKFDKTPPKVVGFLTLLMDSFSQSPT